MPKKFFHTAGNFADHHEELQAVDWSHPVHKGIVFFQNVDAIIGPDEAIVYPEGLTKELDYELELGIVIGKSGKFFGPDEAEDYIAGYLVFNDITARDIQRREMQSGRLLLLQGDRHLLPDRAVDRHQGRAARPAEPARWSCAVNGDVRQQGNTSKMRISIPHLVAHHSAQGYSAGDIITTGTISGVAAIQPNPFDFYLQPGDQIEAEIEGVGILRNHVVRVEGSPRHRAVHDRPYSSERRQLMRLRLRRRPRRPGLATAGRSTSRRPRAVRCPRTRSALLERWDDLVAWAPRRRLVARRTT